MCTPRCVRRKRAVAQYVRDHLSEASELTVGQLAEVARVSEPTVIRFSRKLGFGGYRELRYVLRHPQAERQATFDPLEGFDLNPWDKLDDVPEKTVNAAKTLLDDLLASLDRKELRKAVSLITRARLIDIIGVENSMVPATDLFTKLNYLGLTCRLNADAYMQQIGAGHLEPDDVVVAFSHSGRSADTIKALRLAKSPRRAHHRYHQHPGRAHRQLGRCTAAGRPGGPEDLRQRHLLPHRAHRHGRHPLHGVILSDYGRFSTELDRSGRYIQDRGFGA